MWTRGRWCVSSFQHAAAALRCTAKRDKGGWGARPYPPLLTVPIAPPPLAHCSPSTLSLQFLKKYPVPSLTLADLYKGAQVTM